MAKPTYYRRNSDDQSNEAPVALFKCQGSGCGIRATVFPANSSHGMNGRCTWHSIAARESRDDYDVTKLIGKHSDLIGAFVRMRDMPIQLNDNKKTRGYIAGSDSNGWRNIAAQYPADFPINDDESHHEWADRLFVHLRASVVGAAKRMGE